MLTSETKTINGTKYKVTKLPYGLGKTLLLRLLKILGPAFAQAVAHAPELKGKTLGNLPISQLGPAFGAAVKQLLEGLNEDDFDLMVETLGEYTSIVGEKGVERRLDEAEREFRFSGNYGELFSWLYFALKVNYLNFSKGRDMLKHVLAKAQELQASQSPTT
jgi:hypothetical protein